MMKRFGYSGVSLEKAENDEMGKRLHFRKNG
jgi:hypothetical protein